MHINMVGYFNVKIGSLYIMIYNNLKPTKLSHWCFKHRLHKDIPGTNKYLLVTDSSWLWTILSPNTKLNLSSLSLVIMSIFTTLNVCIKCVYFIRLFWYHTAKSPRPLSVGPVPFPVLSASAPGPATKKTSAYEKTHKVVYFMDDPIRGVHFVIKTKIGFREMVPLI